MYDPREFEKFPGGSPEKQESYNSPDDGFSSLEKMPERRWDQFNTPIQNNEQHEEPSNQETGQEKNQYDEGLTEAAMLINYGIDAVARENGVEATIQGIKTFDASGSENPLRDLYIHLGVDTKKELEDVRDESLATKQFKERLRNEYNMPKSDKRSREGLFKAIADMKELITEVEGTDPKYAELRQSASSAGKGYFEYAVQNYEKRGLTELFSTLASQKEKSTEQKPEDKSETETRTEEETIAEIQPDQSDTEKTPSEPEQEQPDSSEDLEEQGIENDTNSLISELNTEDEPTPETKGALHQVASTELNPEEQKAPDAGSEQEKDPSYRLGQEKKVA